MVFDLDGTLLDTLEDLTDSVNYMLDACGYPRRSLEFVRMAVGNGVRKLIERALPPAAAKLRTDECLSVFRAHYSENLDVKTAPYPGIMDVLDELCRRGIDVGVVSNKYDGAVKALCKKHFGARVPVAIGERPGIRRKPAPDSLLEALRTMGVEPADAVYVGDSDVDVETARNAGLKCIGVSWGFRPRQSLIAAGADAVVDDAASLIDAALAL